MALHKLVAVHIMSSVNSCFFSPHLVFPVSAHAVTHFGVPLSMLWGSVSPHMYFVFTRGFLIVHTQTGQVQALSINCQIILRRSKTLRSQRNDLNT